METLQHRPEAYIPDHTPHTPPYTPYAPSKRRFERADSPASAKSIQPLETSSPAKKAPTPSSADEDNVKVQELVEGDVGYLTDIDVVYPEELEEADSDTEDDPSTSESDDDITGTFSRLDCQDYQQASFKGKESKDIYGSAKKRESSNDRIVSL